MGKIAKTHWKKLDNPNYLGAYSLLDGVTQELTATIEKVVIEEVKSDRGAEPCKVAYLKGQKPLILNTTNCKIITKLFDTPFIEEWAGRDITLHVEKIKAFGETMAALRVKKVDNNAILNEVVELFELKREVLTADETARAEAIIDGKESASYLKLINHLKNA